MQLYDTAARAVRPLEPAADPVTLYVCGITPYDAAHLGHAFTYHVFDVLSRRLVAAGRRVLSVRNVTDADDDIYRAARERRLDWRALVDDQVDRFDAEMAAIDILPVSAAPRASDHVPAMVEWLRRLESTGFAYAVDGWLYFAVSRFDRYGSLSGLGREQMIALSRERGGDPDDARKRDALDFVLWQPSLPDEPRWPSPWGDGRPGWHIECTVLATALAGDGLDIHGGGEDLIYPHHESEIAQAEAAGVHPFARHWVHVAMVQLDGVKMSKSLGNLVFVRDLLAGASPAAVRLLLGLHHHRTPWSYEPAMLAEAVALAERLGAAASGEGMVDAGVAAELEQAFFARLDDDLDTPGAIRVLDRLAGSGVPARTGGIPVAGLVTRLAGVLGARLVHVAAHPV